MQRHVDVRFSFRIDHPDRPALTGLSVLKPVIHVHLAQGFVVQVHAMRVVSQDHAHPMLTRTDQAQRLVVATIHDHHIPGLKREMIQAFPRMSIADFDRHQLQLHQVNGQMQPITDPGGAGHLNRAAIRDQKPQMSRGQANLACFMQVLTHRLQPRTLTA
ncbi:hypothetical protein [Methylohalobius crimeensis]|uniref:hypothetical protein n=1 Tax=Methylohalobius crimeensis TaxID=244365 RepID=UPI00058CB22A|nr:hypothetical protein [Methylohalobius crimeensis]